MKSALGPFWYTKRRLGEMMKIKSEQKEKREAPLVCEK